MTEESSVLPPVEESCKDLLLELFDESIELTKYFEQSSRPYNSDPRDLSRRITRGYKMIIKKGTNRIVLLRFLLAKLVYSNEGLSLEEYLCLYHLFYDLTECSDPIFISKYKEKLEKVSHLLERMRGVRSFPVQYRKPTIEKVREFLLDFIPSAREYYGLAGQRNLRQSFRLILNDTLIPKRCPPVRYIGVGYKDKGTRRNSAVDGSQGWKEIGSYFSNQEREAEELDSSFSETTGQGE